MSIFSISNLAEYGAKPRISFNQFQNTPLSTGNLSNNVHIRYNKSFYDQNLNQEIYDEGQGTTNNSIRSIYSTLSGKGIRENKYDILTGKWDSGYPQNAYYVICDQKLSTIYSLGNSYISRDETVDTAFPRNQNYSLIENNIPNDCHNNQTATPTPTPTATPVPTPTPTTTPTPTPTPTATQNAFLTFDRGNQPLTVGEYSNSVPLTYANSGVNWGLLRSVIPSNIPNWGQS